MSLRTDPWHCITTHGSLWNYWWTREWLCDSFIGFHSVQCALTSFPSLALILYSMHINRWCKHFLSCPQLHFCHPSSAVVLPFSLSSNVIWVLHTLHPFYPHAYIRNTHSHLSLWGKKDECLIMTVQTHSLPPFALFSLSKKRGAGDFASWWRAWLIFLVRRTCIGE